MVAGSANSPTFTSPSCSFSYWPTVGGLTNANRTSYAAVSPKFLTTSSMRCQSVACGSMNIATCGRICSRFSSRFFLSWRYAKIRAATPRMTTAHTPMTSQLPNPPPVKLFHWSSIHPTVVTSPFGRDRPHKQLLTAASYVVPDTRCDCSAKSIVSKQSISSQASLTSRDESLSDVRKHPSALLVGHDMTSTATSQPNNRRRDEVRNVEASPQLTAHLQRVLVDLIELHIQGKQAHWNVVGTNFRDLHLQLDEVVDAAREASDTIAERMRALDAVPDGRSDTVAVTTTLPQFPAFEQNTTDVVDLITTRVYATVDTLRAVHDAVDAEDPSTADLLHQIIDSLEKLAWMIKSENRKI